MAENRLLLLAWALIGGKKEAFRGRKIGALNNVNRLE